MELDPPTTLGERNIVDALWPGATDDSASDGNHELAHEWRVVRSARERRFKIIEQTGTHLGFSRPLT